MPKQTPKLEELDVSIPEVREALLKELSFLESRDDIWYFGQNYLPHVLFDKPAEFHKEIINLMKRERRLGIAAPRNHAKTTLVQNLFVLHTLLTSTDEDILTVSNTANYAKENVRKIKLELENNDKIRRDFGGILAWGPEVSTKWTEEHLTIHDPFTGRIVNQVRSKGWGGQIRGLRPTKIICDDLEDDELVLSEDKRKKLKDWFLAALMGTIKPDQSLFVIGTVLHPLSLLAEIIHNKDIFKGWTTRKYRAINTGDIPLWPERWPLEELKKKKEEIGSYKFSQDFQNEPIPAESVLIKPEMIQRYSETPSFVRVVGACDPAVSTKTSADYTAIVWLGVTAEGKIYEFGSKRGRWAHEETVNHILNDVQNHQPEEFTLETIGFQQILKQLLISEAQKRQIRLPIRDVTLGRYSDKKTKQPNDKYSRLFKVLPDFERGNVYLRNEDLIEELLLFPTGSHDDFVDALVYALMVADRTKKVSVIRHTKPLENPDDYFRKFIRSSRKGGYGWKTAV